MGDISDRFNSVWRDYNTAGVPASGEHEPVKSEIRDVAPLIESAISTAGLGALVSVVYATRAELDADLAHAAGAVALVHSDPIDANNDLYQKTGASGAGAWTLTTALHSIIEARMKPALDQQRALASPFVSSVTEPKLLNLIRDVRVNNGVPGRQYALRLFYDRFGAGSTRRFRIQLYDTVLAENIAWVDVPDALTVGDDVPPTVTATGASAGSPLNNSALAKFTGASVTVWLNQGVINFDSAYNGTADTYAVAGLNTNRVLSREQCRRMILEQDPVREQVITIGATGADFTRLQDALASVLREPGIPRSGYPYSHFCSASHQIRFKLLDKGHTEGWVENVVDQGGGLMIAQGMLVQMGMVIELSENAVLHTTGGATYQGPLFERNYGGAIVGPASARLEQRGFGYVEHIDAGNGLSIPALVGPAVQYFQIVRLFDGPTRWAHAGNDAWMVGRGISDDEYDVDRPGAMIREAGSTTTQAMYGVHTSPGSIRRGRIFIENAYFNDADSPTTAIALITSSGAETQDPRHEITVSNCRLAEIAGSAQYRLMGAIPNGATVSAAMLTA